MVYRYFKCPNCGLHMIFPKMNRDKIGHIKTAYCPFCMKEVDWVLEEN